MLENLPQSLHALRPQPMEMYNQAHGAILYRTTSYFLERLGMASLDELPDLAPFLPENIEDIEDNERTRA